MLATDYSHVIEALRNKARDSAVTPEEAEALNAKADELAGKVKTTTAPISEPKPTITIPRVQYSFRTQQGEVVTKSLDFPEDWYSTADEWWNWESGSMAE